MVLKKVMRVGRMPIRVSAMATPSNRRTDPIIHPRLVSQKDVKWGLTHTAVIERASYVLGRYSLYLCPDWRNCGVVGLFLAFADTSARVRPYVGKY